MRPRLNVLRVLIMWTGWFAGVGLSAQNTLFLPCDATSLTGDQKASRPERLAYPTFLKNTVRSEVTFACTQPADITHPFSVSPDRQVLFSPGNLQYNAALGTHLCADGSVKPGTWRFAEHQWDYVGDTKNGTVYENGVKCDNTRVSESYNGWIDLFGWGTSGWESGAVAYQPWATSTTETDYQPGGDPGNHLTEDYAYADWAVYNPIGDDPAGTWRTLTMTEWTYVFEQRPGYALLRGQATVCGVHGYMLLPDDWVAPAGITFTGGTDIGYDVNVYSPEQWEAMEAEGAVFLSASGSRTGTAFGDNAAGNRGAYWSASGSGNKNAYRMWFRENGAEVAAADRNFGRPVRPVKDLPSRYPPTDYQPMPFSVSADRQVCFSPGNLQYNASRGTHRCADGSVQPGTWRFAEHQWDYVGDAQNGTVYHNGTKCSNTQTSESYNGWIDLFGWGTSGWNSGAKAWQPWATSVSNSDYYPGGSETDDLTGGYAYSDWARYNTIGYHPAGTWRTLAKDEWVWLFHERENAERLFGMGTVNGVQGTIILPDGWVAPAGITFNASTDKGLEWYGTYYESSTKDVYSHNVYTDLQWGKMEAAGAVFLPAGGGRSGTTVNYASESGNYWSSSRHSAEYAFRMRFYTHYLNPSYDSGQNLGRSVRPVRDVEPPPPPSAYEPKPFSVSADRQVLFSPGNLQYNAALGTHPCADGTTKKGTWRFAEHQYDYVGDTEKGNVYENGVKCRNSRVSNTYDGWIDLFGWGTSGWNSGSNAYQPWETSQTSRDYMPGGNAKNNLTGVYAYSDWGVYNAVGDDPAGTWRTLTKEEWTYLFRERENADKLFGLGTVNGVKGTVILPDGWVTPPGVTFNASTDKGLSWQETNYANSAEDNYSHNAYTALQWEEQMAANGAVFLPSAGYRYGTTMTKTGEYGSYWSASACETEYISDFNFSESRLCPQYDARRFGGRSVRPVKDVAPPPPPSAYEPKPFSVSADRQVLFSPGNLQYNAALGTHQCADGTTQPGTWRFAEHQWDYAGDTENGTVWHNGIKCDNTQASESYNGWIDLFGWGTSGWESGAKAYQPWATSQTNQDYYPGGNENNNLSGDYANADWGVYNQIADDAPGTWRVLSNEEWRYVFHERENAESLFGLGTVNGVPGTIILPDGWVTPPGVTFNASTGKGLSWQGSSYDDSGSDHFSDNTYTSLQWEEQMAANGAIFLPAAGNRIGTSVSAIGTSGRYWSSTQHDPEGAFYLIFNSDHLHPHGDFYRNYGRSVRPVKDVTPLPSAYEPKPFSVSPDRQVTFSPGNLQFNAAQGSHLCADGSTKQGTWRFAVYQWDCVGDAEYGTVWHNRAKCSNTDIGETYNGWIDLFGWGTSGWESGAQAYQPWAASTTDEDYRPGGNEENDLTGSYAYSDWAVYNPIGDDPAGTWRTLTNDEWVWLFQKRADAERLFGLGTVNGVHGTIVLPDGWTAPDGTVFTANTTEYSGNVYSEKQWAVMESAGAVFLPVTGNRRGTEIVNVSERGDVWSSTHSSSDGAYSFCFSTEYFLPQSDSHRRNGRSVRPVKDVTPLPSAYEPKPFSVSPDRQITFSPGNLQFNAAQGSHLCADGSTKQGTWRFAVYQWDCVGDAEYGTVLHNGTKCSNTNIGETYNGWIDLFGWGTSGWESGAESYQPWSSNPTESSYYPGGSETNDLTGDYAYADWAVYNPIGDDPAGSWRTLTNDEWYYLITTRPDAKSKYGAAKVNGVTGVVLLPDDFTLPAGSSFTAVMTPASDWYDWSLVNTTNIYTVAQWRRMEAAGAVFLPCSGGRYGIKIGETGAGGYYWSSSFSDSNDAHSLYFGSRYLYCKPSNRHLGRGVRPVKDVTPQPSAYEPKPFSVSADRQITFSPGNLQYNAAQGTHQCADGTTQQGIWRFAEHQWDIVGMGYGQTDTSGDYYCHIGGTVHNGDNRNIGDTYDGWIDLFGWGTSGWNSGASAYQPWATSTDYSDYYPGGSYENNLTGNYANADWGVYNQIGEDEPGSWRTLTYDEWHYLIETRPDASNKYGVAKVNGMTGMVILPDEFTLPSGCGFTAGMTSASDWYDWSSVATTNIYTSAQWQLMEAAGAVFLPCAGRRTGTAVYRSGTRGDYWSSTAYGTYSAYNPDFGSEILYWYSYHRNYGRSVRLVSDIAPPTPPSAYEPKPFSVSADRQITFSPGNLQYNAALGTHQCADGTTQQGTWRFAEHQWDYVGDAENGTVWHNGAKCSNTNIGSDYNGWIDLFCWGTSGWNSGSKEYQPWAISLQNDDYVSEGNEDSDLTGNFAFADWGIYNEIEGDAPGTWRSLTKEESDYLLHDRPNADKLFGFGTVNDIVGVILLPDDWTTPSGVTFASGSEKGMVWSSTNCIYNSTNEHFADNVYTEAQWQQMEKTGAVFLSAAGYRASKWCDGMNEDGNYRLASSTIFSSQSGSCYIDITANSLYSKRQNLRYHGFSVRLVKDIAPPSTYNPQPFSVSADRQITFSPGNLQYNAALGTHQCADGTTQQGTWRFAVHQWDYVGDEKNGNVYQNGIKCVNTQISDTYNGWIDLLGWGSSGWSEGVKAYQPWAASAASNDYCLKEIGASMTGDYAYADWCVYNGIGVYAPKTWRTLTKDEWHWLFCIRENAENLFALGTVNGVQGVILLPDGWEMQDGITFNPSTEKGLKWTDSRYDNTAGGDRYNDNVYTVSQWALMESFGAVFLPVTGYRAGLVFDHADGFTDGWGHYWSATADKANVYRVNFSKDYLSPIYQYGRNRGFAVRPVKDIAPLPSAYEPKPFSVSPERQITFSLGNLQYNAAQGSHRCADGTTKKGTWRFAEHQWDYVGDAKSGNVYQNGVKCDNALISDTYDGWIDFFGWGTSGWNSGAKEYQPWATSKVNDDYISTGNEESDLTGTLAWADWGMYNEIDGDTPGTWRSLTKEESYYLLVGRANADRLFGFGTVNGITGLILLPDEWTTPSEVTFASGGEKGMEWNSNSGLYNSSNDHFADNVYTDAQWQKMENAGAVFLPAAGYRRETTGYSVGESGNYWLASYGIRESVHGACYMNFPSNRLYPERHHYRYNGGSVRLVKDIVPPPPPSAYNPQPFSISPDRQITFAPGNLQYNAAQGSHQCADGTTQQGTWRFAEHQWDIVGMGYGQTNTNSGYYCYIGGTVPNGDNQNISNTYNGWIDLFGWGTSGWDSGANAYQPWATSTTSTDYTPGNNSSNDLTGNYENADWGMYNQIGDDEPGTWRTLTYDEWYYLVNTRTNAGSKYGAAKVNGMTGVVILPDVFTLPTTCGFTAGMTSANNWYDWSSVASTNIYTAAQWQLMEAAGAVFLPCAGYRSGTTMLYSGTSGYCWSSTANDTNNANMGFDSNGLGWGYDGCDRGGSVRLVKDIAPPPPPSAYNPQPFSVSADRQILFSSGNLQFNAAQGIHLCADGSTLQGTWRFAEHQYDYVGNAEYGTVYMNGVKCDNELVSESYDGWIDLFGWGTTGWDNGAKAYQPWSTSQEDDDYVFADWGAYNQIGNDPAGTWRVLTGEEWKYILEERPNYANLRGQATIDGIVGYMLLPDDWEAPEGITFTGGTDIGYNVNVYTLHQWSAMEAAGAVFLPAACSRKGTEWVLAARNRGAYWSSTSCDSKQVIRMYFRSDVTEPACHNRFRGRTARLVRDIPAAPPPSAYEPKPFSVSADRQITFSPGNLQYNAAQGTHQCADGTTQQGTWRFAEHQWDIAGMGYGQTNKDNHCYIGGTVQNGDNRSISETCDGWIDLFGWGTSGWNSGAAACQPWATSVTNSDYHPGGSYENNLTGNCANADWGVYNRIGDDGPGTWRTLTYDEWNYLINTRTNAGSKYGVASVNGMTGVVILPDAFTLPADCGFTPGMTNASDWYDWSSVATTNIYTSAQWQLMEAAGAVFLPCAGDRNRALVFGAGAAGRYWLSTANNSDNAYYVSFSSDGLHTYANYRYRGFSVRLVKDQTPPPPPSAYNPQPFSISPDRQITFAPGNLQFNAAQGSHQCADGTTQQGTWRFAEHQWEYVGDAENGNVYQNGIKCDNALISDTYDGWIDLFSWGTSGWSGGVKAYQPWATSKKQEDYVPGGDINNNLTGDYAYADWTIYNQIGNDAPSTWRTLTEEEWRYLFEERPGYAERRGHATVNGVQGYILLPDDWTMPDGMVFKSGTNDNFQSNVYEQEQWQAMESAGAVFLPAAGSRDGEVLNPNSIGNRVAYWAVTACDANNAYRFSIVSGLAEVACNSRYLGRPVRPVKDIAPPIPPSAYEPKPFSVAADRQITFSSGNLQYNAAQGSHQCADGITQQGTWRFAEHQWDYVGDSENGNVYQNGIKCNNALISDTYDGWIDLFCWGTSGWDSGAKAYLPWATNSDNTDYTPGGSETNNLTGDYANADWGIYNPIGGDPAGTWRTLTGDEWNYLISARPDAVSKCGASKVNGMTGLVILPDDFTLPTGCGFTPGKTTASDWDDWTCVATTNIYSAEQWQLMEQNGAVFLPCAGYRKGTKLSRTGMSGYCWSSTAYDANNAYRLDFSPVNLNAGFNSRCFARSVRLVKDQTPPPSAYNPQPFSIAPDRQITFSPGNLQYNAAQGNHQCADGTTHQGTWRFAEHQWDYVGNTKNGTVYHNGTKCSNTKIGSKYDGWIDLFAWGTSGWNSGAKYYQPWHTNKDNINYQIGGKLENDLRGEYSYADWGVFNDIMNGTETNPAGMWRTMTEDEWGYIVLHRPNAADLFALATVNGVKGMILLPDNWNPADKPHLNTSTEQGFYVTNDTIYNDNTDTYDTNILSATQWLIFEAAGAVFLPSAGHRHEKTVHNLQKWGDYSPSTNMANRYWKDKYELPIFFFSDITCKAGCPTATRYCGKSVRLVSDYPPPSAYNPQPFSIAPDKQITFSPGNLQYNATQGTHQCADGTTLQGTWRFAEHQWDYVGDTEIGTVYHNGTKCSNTKISSKYDGWIDLFAWGTSGWNSGAKNYRPWNEGKTNSNYLIGGKVENDMRGKYSYADWGVYNDIVNGTKTDPAGTWHTMTENDWAYIVLHRPNAAELFALATVNGVKGMILLPDNWNPADKPHIVTSTEQGFYVANDTIYNDQRGSYETNILSATQWLTMEAAGAVFLPCAGHRHEKTLQRLQEWGDYTPSTNMAKRYIKSKYELPVFFFSAVSCKPGCPSNVRYCGKSIRLVSDYQPSSTVPPRSTVAADYWTPYTEYWPEEPDPWISTGHRTATAELWTDEAVHRTPKPERKTPKEDDPEEDNYVEEPADTLCWQPSYRFHDYDYPLPDLSACLDRDYVAYTLEYFDKDACMHYLKDIVIATNEGGTVELYDTICDGSPYDFFGDQLTKTDVYTHTVPIARDCEQVYILHLTVHPSYSGIEQTEHICPSGSFVWNGSEYTDEGDYTLSLSSANGCDSLVTLHLRHYPYYERQLNDTLLTGQTILFEGTELAEAGTYSVTLPTVDGCDSVITLMLEENAVQVLSAECNDLCSDKEELHISLDFTGTAHSVRLTFDSAAHVAGWRDTLILLTDDGDIVLPARGRVGQFTCTAELLFRDTTAASVTIPFTLPYPSTVLKQLWDDGVAVMNADYNGGYDFVAFQWYENGVPLAGETASILYRPLIMGGEYSALLTESNGRQMLCCPLIATSRTALETPDIGITIYPTLASPSETIRCHAERQAELTVYDIHGRMVDRLTVPAGSSVFTAPVVPGLYMVLMQPLHSGRAATVKMMVIPGDRTATKQ